MKQTAVTISSSRYENVYWTCPTCGKDNIANRIDDLHHARVRGSYQSIVCQNAKCANEVNLVGDTLVTSKYRWFIDELYTHVQRKEYVLYVTSLCQAMEAFFYQGIINKKFDRNPDYRNKYGHIKLEEYNAARKVYEECIEKWSYVQSKREFMVVYKNEKQKYVPISLGIAKDERRQAFKTVLNSPINTLRNNVLHKYLYRPSINDIEQFGTLITYLYWLEAYLGIKESDLLINMEIKY